MQMHPFHSNAQGLQLAGFRYNHLLDLWFNDRDERCVELKRDGTVIPVSYAEYQEHGNEAPEPLSLSASQPNQQT